MSRPKTAPPSKVAGPGDPVHPEEMTATRPKNDGEPAPVHVHVHGPRPADATCGPEEHARRAGRRKPVNEGAFARAAALFRAVGDVPRLKILDRLSDGEWCVTELAEAAGVGISTVSQQLRTLRAERIVARRRTGKHIFYSLADEHVRDLIHNALEHATEEQAAGHEEDTD